MIFTLIGMPGSGKSVMAKTVASKLKIRHMDGDRLIERTTGRKLQTIINEDGVDAFKKIEHDVLLSFESDVDLVFSTGGSAVYYDDVMRHLASRGPIIYLYVGLPELLSRLGDFSKRGIVLKPGQTIGDLFRERAGLYEKYADAKVNCNGAAYPRYQREVIRVIERYRPRQNAAPAGTSQDRSKNPAPAGKNGKPEPQ